jgi:predicted nucleic acid-binding protein
MPNKILTFVDASVLIYCIRKTTPETRDRKRRAIQVIGDPDREFIASEFLRLEVMPLSYFLNKSREIAFLEQFFRGITQWVNASGLIKPAYELACRYGLGALDALHVAAAQQADAEFVSGEKTTKPIYTAYARVSTIYS